MIQINAIVATGEFFFYVAFLANFSFEIIFKNLNSTYNCHKGWDLTHGQVIEVQRVLNGVRSIV